MKLKHQDQFYNCCRCKFSGFYCGAFEKYVDAEFINNCKFFSQSERISLVSETTDKINCALKDLSLDQVWYNYYKMMYDDTHHLCEEANAHQKQKDIRIINTLEKLDLSNTNYEDIKIFFLGHYESLLKNINNPIFIPKNLSDLDIDEKYKDNKWAESRAFLLKEQLLSMPIKYTGFVTASWNNKFIGEDINKFDEWIYSRYLLNSQREDNIVLCADVHCICLWKYSLYTIFKMDNLWDQFLYYFGLNVQHIKVPFCNQFIAHKSVIQEYLEFLYKNNIFEKVKQFVLEFISPFIVADPVLDRSEAYIMEMITCFWFADKDYYYIPNGIRSKNWYNKKNIETREKEYVSFIST